MKKSKLDKKYDSSIVGDKWYDYYYQKIISLLNPQSKNLSLVSFHLKCYWHAYNGSCIKQYNTRYFDS